MRKPIILSSLALAVAIATGGFVIWHFMQPTVAEQSASVADDIDRSFTPYKAQPDPTTSTATPIPAKLPTEPTRKKGKYYAVVRIPNIGVKFPIIEGTDTADLKRAVGHYTWTAKPGEVGNYALAGHVNGNFAPLEKLYKLKTNDVVFVDTDKATYAYKIIDGTNCGKSQKIVHMSEIQVVYPVPCAENTKPTERLITLTTCAYPNGEKPPAIHRRIVWGELVQVTPRA